MGRQRAADMIGGIAPLPIQGRKELTVGAPHGWIGRWTVGADGLVQGWQRVIGRRWIHVMLDVIVHVPVQKALYRIYQHGPRVEPMVQDILRQAGVLDDAEEVV